MFDIQKQGFTFSASRHLRLAVALGALAFSPGMVSALDLDLGIGRVTLDRGGVGVNLLGDRGVNANVNTGGSGSGGGLGADVSVGGSGGVNANVGVGGQGVGVNASVGGSGGVNANVGVGTGGVNVGIGTGSGGNGGNGGNNPGGNDPGGNDPGGNDPGGTNPGNGGGTPGNGIVISNLGMVSLARLEVPATCAKAGNYDLLIGVPVLTSANQMIGVIAGAYVEGGMLTRLRVAVDPAYAPPGGCVEIANLAGSQAGVDGFLLNVSMPALQGALR